jgi:hypothetical protein
MAELLLIPITQVALDGASTTVTVQEVSYKDLVHCLNYNGNMSLLSILLTQILLFFILHHLHEIQFSFIDIIALQADQRLNDRISFANHYN